MVSHSGADGKSEHDILKTLSDPTTLPQQTQSNPDALPKSHQQEQEVPACAVAQRRLKMHLQEALSSYGLELPIITSSLGTERERKQDPVRGFC